MKLSEQIKNCLDGSGCKDCESYEQKSVLTCRVLLEKAYERIKRYEDIFPCEVGDKVYAIHFKKIHTFFVEGFEICSEGTYIKLVSKTYGFEYLKMSLDVSCFGKEWFLTREQAEAELKKNEEAEE